MLLLLLLMMMMMSTMMLSTTLRNEEAVGLSSSPLLYVHSHIQFHHGIGKRRREEGAGRR